MAFKNKQKESKKPTTLAEYKAQGWEVSPYVGMSNPPVYTLTKDGETIKFRPKMKFKPGMPKPPNRKQPKKEATPMKKKDGGSASKFGMLSVKAGIDNNPNPTQADRIAGATKKMKRGGAVDSPKKKKKKKKGFLGIAIEMIRPKTIQAAKGGLAGRLAKRGYGKAKK